MAVRGRRRILGETLAYHISGKLSIPSPAPDKIWFLSDLWFESAEYYSPEVCGIEIPQRVIDAIRRDPARALFEYLLFRDEHTRMEAVRRYSAGSADLIQRIDGRRAIGAGATLALRKTA